MDILTITFNPAIDYIVDVSNLAIGKTNRATRERVQFGGKGINVSYVLGELGMASKALGFVGGFTGEEIERMSQENGVQTDFIKLENGNSRINIKIKDAEETEINGCGAVITKADIQKLQEKLSCVSKGDVVVLSGSVPLGLPKNIYCTIMQSLGGSGAKFIVDATGELLLATLSQKPFMIKPNRAELEEITKEKLTTTESVVLAGKKLQSMGAQNVLISLGEEGGILIDEFGKIHSIAVADGKVQNTVGSGDSMVAGFIAGYAKTKDYREALILGGACGSATAFSVSLAKRCEIEKLHSAIEKTYRMQCFGE